MQLNESSKTAHEQLEQAMEEVDKLQKIILEHRKTIEETRPFFNLDHSPPLPQLTYNPYFLTDLSPSVHPIFSILNQSRASKRQSLTTIAVE